MIEIIPAMDLIDGKCVRLTHGDFSRKTVYSDDPLETARRFADAGLRRLHMVDLDGAKRGKPANLSVLERVATGTELDIDFGGGIKTAADIEAVFAAGASIANIGSMAVKEPDTFLAWVERFGAERILLGADCKDEKIAVDGWQTQTEVSILDFLERMNSLGLKRSFVTDIGRDGVLAGPSVELYERLIAQLPGLELIASGGVSSIDEIAELESIGCAGVIVGKAIYEGRITMEDLARYAR